MNTPKHRTAEIKLQKSHLVLLCCCAPFRAPQQQHKQQNCMQLRKLFPQLEESEFASLRVTQNCSCLRRSMEEEETYDDPLA
jgi:hypothetical protein